MTVPLRFSTPRGRKSVRVPSANPVAQYQATHPEPARMAPDCGPDLTGWPPPRRQVAAFVALGVGLALMVLAALAPGGLRVVLGASCVVWTCGAGYVARRVRSVPAEVRR